MSRNSWIYLILMVMLFVTLTVVLVILLMPQSEEFESSVSYTQISEDEYKYTSVKTDPSTTQIQENYEVTQNDIKKAQNKNEYVPGNINPFTPKGEVTIYNEPSLSGGNGSANGNTSNGSSISGK